MKKIFIRRLYITLSVTIVVWLFLLWEYTHGGVRTHHILADENMPGLSNWWGGLLLPALTWFLLYRMQRRLDQPQEQATQPQRQRLIVYGFCSALLFGIMLSIFFTLRQGDLAGLMMLSVFVLALFVPVYRAEYLLGLVIGMMYTFGTMLPTMIGTILVIITAFIYLLVRRAALLVIARIFK